jgi:hypothetical protein
MDNIMNAYSILVQKKNTIKWGNHDNKQSNTQEIAKTIIQQIKATDYWALGAWGYRNPVALREGQEKHGYILGGIQFDVSGKKLPRGGKVLVYLMGDDTYTVRVVRIHGTKVNEIKLVEQVYCDDLMRIIDQIIEN